MILHVVVSTGYTTALSVIGGKNTNMMINK